MPPTTKRAQVLRDLQLAAVETKRRTECSPAELSEALHLLTLSAIWAAESLETTEAPATEEDWDAIGEVFHMLHSGATSVVQLLVATKRVRDAIAQSEADNE